MATVLATRHLASANATLCGMEKRATTKSATEVPLVAPDTDVAKIANAFATSASWESLAKAKHAQ